MTQTATTARVAAGNPVPVLKVDELQVAYRTGGELRTVLHGDSFTIEAGERVAIVGESGSGKSTTAAAVLALLPGSGRITGGRIEFKGEDITSPSPARLSSLRGREIGLVPQDPMSNLNPVLKVGRQIAETLAAHNLATGAAARKRAIELMGEAGIPDAARRARQYPHEFSGGMRQRVLIAIGLACQPELLIADEPTSALDVTVQRQILDHLESLRAARGTSLMLITHDLGLAADRADKVVVMSAGRIVEAGPAVEILRHPQADYTRRLVAAAPSVATARVQFGGEDLSSLTVGDHTSSAHPADQAEIVLDAKNLTKRYRLRGHR
ncbi:MAG: ABC transporter ATP-binding protein, partial [Propionibacteriaceae bacterium]|nr:ABC transporter ATP-binding protein [Propionibacteriaceae bacterium]